MSSTAPEATSSKATSKKKGQKQHKQKTQDQTTTENNTNATEAEIATVEKNNLKIDNNKNTSTSSSGSNQNSNDTTPTTAKCIYLINNFEDYKAILKTAGDRLVLLDFFADWCKPCRLINPKLDELAAAHSNEIIIMKIDIDHADDLSNNFNITVVPTIIFMRNDKKLEQLTGVQKDRLKQTVLTLLAKSQSVVKKSSTETVTAAPSGTNIEEKKQPFNISMEKPIKITSVTKIQAKATPQSSTTITEEAQATNNKASKSKDILPVSKNSKSDSKTTIATPNAYTLNSEKSNTTLDTK